MKQTDIKKILKTSTATIHCHEGNYGIMSASLVISYTNEYGSQEHFLTIEAQANDRLYKSDYGNSFEEAKNAFRSFPSYSGFYACQTDCRVKFDGYRECAQDPKRAESFFELVHKIAEFRNLHHVTNCNLTIIIMALESLGCAVSDITVNNRPFSEWRKTRLEKIEPITEQKAS